MKNLQISRLINLFTLLELGSCHSAARSPWHCAPLLARLVLQTLPCSEKWTAGWGVSRYLHREDFLSKAIQTFHFIDVHQLRFSWQDSTEIKTAAEEEMVKGSLANGRLCLCAGKFQSCGSVSGKSNHYPMARTWYLTR